MTRGPPWGSSSSTRSTAVFLRQSSVPSDSPAAFITIHPSLLLSVPFSWPSRIQGSPGLPATSLLPPSLSPLLSLLPLLKLFGLEAPGCDPFPPSPPACCPLGIAQTHRFMLVINSIPNVHTEFTSITKAPLSHLDCRVYDQHLQSMPQRHLRSSASKTNCLILPPKPIPSQPCPILADESSILPATHTGTLESSTTTFPSNLSGNPPGLGFKYIQKPITPPFTARGCFLCLEQSPKSLTFTSLLKCYYLNKSLVKNAAQSSHRCLYFLVAHVTFLGAVCFSWCCCLLCGMTQHKPHKKWDLNLFSSLIYYKWHIVDIQ